MEFITTFSFRAPHEKTKLASSGQAVNTEPQSEDKIAAAYFRAPPVLLHQATAPEMADEFDDILERARRANR
jgi:hypothetical protein